MTRPTPEPEHGTRQAHDAALHASPTTTTPPTTSPRPPQIRVDWSDASRVIRERLAAVVGGAGGGGGGGMGRAVVVVGVTGPVGAGKSTLAAAVAGPDGRVLATDHYLPDYDGIPYGERDHPRHADLARLASDIDGLRAGRAVDAPVWSFHTHRREGYRPVHPAAVIVCEGIHALHASVRDRLDLSVFVDAGAGVRWRRWERLEASGQRGWGVDAARAYFDGVADPTFALFEQDYREHAHVVVVNDRDAGG